MPVKSKVTWGRESPKEAAELNRLCAEFWEKLVVPAEWKGLGWSNVVEPETNILLSVGKVYMDKRTSNMKLMHYRVFFLSASQRGGICEKFYVDYGKPKLHTVYYNKTVEKLNEFIQDKYGELPAAQPPEGGVNGKEADPGDGLQDFRDRFGAGVADKTATDGMGTETYPKF